MPARATCRTRGFTLFELLVVIAIIAVLASLLMPAVAMVRKNARKVVCRSHLHQFHLAVASYANDNEDQVPLWIEGTKSAGVVWYQRLEDYMDRRYVKNGASLLRQDVLPVCPEWKHGNKYGDNTDTDVGYGMNNVLGAQAYKRTGWWPTSDLDPTDNVNYGLFRLGSLTYADARPLFGDAMKVDLTVQPNPAAPGQYRFWVFNATAGTRTGDPNRHGPDRANYLLCDGASREVPEALAAMGVQDPSKVVQ